MKILPGGVCEAGTTRINKTGGWRTFKPVYDYEKCIKCKLCELLCPDSSINPRDDGFFEFDYDFCKGCGICANECPKDAIDMVLEEK
ncbi:pyruvate synthase subunit PorD [Methanolobus sp. ZRKC5]|uniref:pyruvate synthase subunit PorD n=1 Tax=Methanolobus sp. ZRKC5 TaxID=3136295 RepID=UPI00313CF49B